MENARIPGSRNHVPELDGLRGVAILLVMGFHFTVYSGIQPGTAVDRVYYAWAMVGWCGVDLFFVLSGLLITGILIDTKTSSRYLGNFYARRFLRIFPLYYGFLLIVLVIIPRFAHSDWRAVTEHQGFYWTYLSNVLYAQTGWPEHRLTRFLLGHLWSLSIEEQFYIVWPVVVLVFHQRTLATVCIVLVGLSLAVRIAFAAMNNETAGYVLTIARMDSLASGAFLAVAARQRSGLTRWRPLAKVVALLCLLSLATLSWWRDGLSAFDPVVQTAGYSLFAGLFASGLALTLSSHERDFMRRFFLGRALRFLGRYSYGLYVFHHPVIYFLLAAGMSVDLLPTMMGSALPAQLLFDATALCVSLGLAMLSWHLWESPLLALKVHFR